MNYQSRNFDPETVLPEYALQRFDVNGHKSVARTGHILFPEHDVDFRLAGETNMEIRRTNGELEYLLEEIDTYRRGLFQDLLHALRTRGEDVRFLGPCPTDTDFLDKAGEIFPERHKGYLDLVDQATNTGTYLKGLTPE